MQDKYEADNTENNVSEISKTSQAESECGADENTALLADTIDKLANENYAAEENAQKPKAPSTAPADKKFAAKKKKNPLFTFLKVIAGFVAFVALILIGWVLYCLIVRTDIEKHVPENFSFYVSVPSASKLLNQTLELQALDEVLSDKSFEAAYAAVKAMRANEFLSSKLFSMLANVRTDVAVYSSGEASQLYLFVDLGLSSSVTRLLPLILRFNPHLFIDAGISDIEILNDSAGRYYSYSVMPESKILFRFYKNLLIAKVSTTQTEENDFAACLQENDYKFRKTFITDLKKNTKGTINVLADLNGIKPSLTSKQGVMKNILNEITFPERSNVNCILKNDSIQIGGDLKLHTESSELKNIFANKASVPKMINRIPETVEYFTLLNFSSPDELLKNLKPFFTDEINQAYKNADRLAKTFLGATLDKLMLSWIGEELGVFALDSIAAPVFFTSIKDKDACNAFFEKLFASALIDQNSTTVVDGIRISRIVFPPAIKFLLRLFGIDLPTPFYFIDDGFVFFSESAEGIAKYKSAYKDGNTIIKNENIKMMLKNSSSETSLLLYYDLDRSIPFFLQQNKMLGKILSHYGTGILSFKLEGGDKSSFSLYAVQKERKALKTISSFPKQVSGRLYGTLHYAKTKAGTPYLFWSTGEKLFSYNTTSDTISQIKTDSQTLITLELDSGKLKTVWALSKNGIVYKMNENLDSIVSPILTGYKSVGELVVLPKGECAFSLQDESRLAIVSATGEVRLSDDLYAKMTNSPLIYQSSVLIALPRSFDSQVHFLSTDGIEGSRLPIELEGICAVKPVAFEGAKKTALMVNITEAGVYTLHDFRNEQGAVKLHEKELGYSVRVQPVYSKNLNAVMVLDTSGVLHSLELDGTETASVKISQYSDDMQLTLKDITEDNQDEVFVSGGGNAVYAYSSQFTLLDGFPILGISNPVFLDVNSDGTEDILTFGIDSKLSAFSGFWKAKK
jgi:hypothetical protein